MEWVDQIDWIAGGFTWAAMVLIVLGIIVVDDIKRFGEDDDES